jgi:hypothetical protein
MSEGVPAVGAPWASAVVDGVDIDAVAAAARSCEGVDDLCPGPWGGVVSYLPGRQVAGVRIESDHVVISVRGRWGVPVAELARQVRAAVAGLVAPRRVDVVVADLADADSEAPAGLPAPGMHGDEVSSWTTSSAGGLPGASTFAPITPTTAVIPRPSSPA